MEWAIAGRGLLLKSLIDVAADVRDGTLEHVLPGWMSQAAPIYMLFQSRHHVPSKVRVFVDAIASRFAQVRE